MQIELNKLNDINTVIKIDSASIPIANLKRVWFKLDKNSEDYWEIYKATLKNYTIKTVSRNETLYKNLSAKTIVWIE
tara:strand:- start:4126 stop:4356 length:231 start_codon:yes stop_codon:yes gene_type:complete